MPLKAAPREAYHSCTPAEESRARFCERRDAPPRADHRRSLEIGEMQTGRRGWIIMSDYENDPIHRRVNPRTTLATVIYFHRVRDEFPDDGWTQRCRPISVDLLRDERFSRALVWREGRDRENVCAMAQVWIFYWQLCDENTKNGKGIADSRDLFIDCL